MSFAGWTFRSIKQLTLKTISVKIVIAFRQCQHVLFFRNLVSTNNTNVICRWHIDVHRRGQIQRLGGGESSPLCRQIDKIYFGCQGIGYIFDISHKFGPNQRTCHFYSDLFGQQFAISKFVVIRNNSGADNSVFLQHLYDYLGDISFEYTNI